MAFAPGQFITAQRLNRLQSKTYWVATSAGLPASATPADIPGTSLSITVETNGATAAMFWSMDSRATGVPGGLASARAFWDVNGSPVFAVFKGQASTDDGTAAQNWATTIPTAGTYTFKLNGAPNTNNTFNLYTAMTTIITEVA